MDIPTRGKTFIFYNNWNSGMLQSDDGLGTEGVEVETNLSSYLKS